MEQHDQSPIRIAFATVLRRKRNERGLSQEELGFRAGITMRYVSLLETGKRQPTITSLENLCNALEISMSEFVGLMEKEK